MKRIFSILVTISMMLMLMVPVQAAGEATITVEYNGGPVGVGETAEFAVSVANNPGFTNFQFRMDYDADCLELVSFDTSHLQGFMPSSNIDTGIVAAARVDTYTEADAPLFFVAFEVKDTATAGNTAVTIDPIKMINLVDGTPIPVEFTYVPGTVEIAGADIPTNDIPTNDIPTNDIPTNDIPTNDIPTNDIPTNDIPTNDIPTNDIPTNDIPTNDIPTNDIPTNDIPDSDLPDGDIVTSLGSGSTEKCTVTFENNGGNGILSIVVDKNEVLEEPEEPTKEGFKFAGWYVDAGLTKLYNFNTLVTQSFTLYAKWVEENAQVEFPFEDVAETDWFYEAVKFAFEKNLVNGVSDTEFAPDEKVTRASLIAILYRLEGEPATNKSIPFADVAMDKYYANAVIWADQNEIIKGVSETEFAPEVNITREQIATIIYRYAKYNNYDLSVVETTDLSSFNDADQISDYAVDAMKYAVGIGIIRGRSNAMLAPKDYASRAEFVQILYNFFK